MRHPAASAPKAQSKLVLATSFTPLVWGTTYIVATEFLPDGRPMLAAAVRALPIGVILVARSRLAPKGAWWWRAAVLGFLNIGAFFALLFVAAFRLPGGVAATAGAIQPIVASVIAVFVLGEVFTRRTAVAGAFGVVGVALLVIGPDAALDPIGLAVAFGGTLSMATGVVLTKHWGRPVDLMTFTGWQLTVGGLMLVPVALLAEGIPPAPTLTNLIGFGWLAIIGTGVAYSLWFRGVQILPVAMTSFLVLLSPLMAAALGWIFLSEDLTLLQIVGAVIVAMAVIAPQIPSSARRCAHRHDDAAAVQNAIRVVDGSIVDCGLVPAIQGEQHEIPRHRDGPPRHEEF